ncbi:aminotransferase class I/II-fold pyridoxal phosphate-dependent enzyme [Marinomonas mediterranea]|uniref:aminotransferase class I/II-fold pyridoxal phosphate-dependent enzyme n=1 Tax=Marinomonas mediterranea TaxID=119864 RepID=UPI00234BDF2D|nr:aminotransferase class I/II-fold pyridoxal phosphate-dependent enzyme [Marinomonas mediterranea]WCN10606.1 aminotransferase class I/II-fold pyridoxal phosphate-dependent enzyme [Marinomonas mediterranea]
MHFDIKPPKHGGDLKKWSRKTNGAAKTWLDLSSACNREPWPIPEIPMQEWHELPDQDALYHAAQEYFHLKPIAIGSGSQQFIEALPTFFSANASIESNAQKVVKVPLIGYQEHAFAWKKWGFRVESYRTVEELIDSTWFAAVIINPNNPTGECLSSDVLSQLLSQVLSQIEKREEDSSSSDVSDECHLIIDEAFMDATPEQSLLFTQAEQIERSNVWVMRSVGKFFGLPGARIGFLFAAEKYANSINNLIGPWPVSTPALYLVEQALKDIKWQESARASLAKRHDYFWQIIRPKLNTVFDSQAVTANALFYTWQLESQQDAERAFDWLQSVGVHVRQGESWIRVALPALSEMDRLDKSLIRLIRGEGGKDLS